jgi:hypothetical protein
VGWAATPSTLAADLRPGPRAIDDRWSNSSVAPNRSEQELGQTSWPLNVAGSLGLPLSQVADPYIGTIHWHHGFLQVYCRRFWQ